VREEATWLDEIGNVLIVWLFGMCCGCLVHAAGCAVVGIFKHLLRQAGSVWGLPTC
jgi:hypothetical protein